MHIKLKSLIEGIVREDATDDALTDLTKKFDAGSIEDYVAALQKYSADPKVAAVIKAGQTDGDPADEKLNVGGGSIAVKELKPTQNEIGAQESLKNILTDEYGSLDGFLKGNASFDDPIITYNGQFVIDGHHRWSQVYAANPDAKVPVLDIKGNLEPEQILKAVHAAIVTIAGKSDTKDANLKAGNLLAFSEQNVRDMVSKFLTVDARDVWAANGYDSDEQIADHIVTNVNTMLANSKPENWAPARSSMPQPNDSGAPNFADALKSGAANFLAPSTGDVKTESISKDRWAKLANIKK
jgi:hypothetical protein